MENKNTEDMSHTEDTNAPIAPKEADTSVHKRGGGKLTVANDELAQQIQELSGAVRELREKIEKINDDLTPEPMHKNMKKRKIPTKDAKEPGNDGVQNTLPDTENDVASEPQTALTSENAAENDKTHTDLDSEKTNGKQKKKKNKKLSLLRDILFYTALVAMVFGVFLIRSNSDGQPVMVAGYSAFMVRTGSMQSEIPKGSLVITKKTDADELNVGDDITFMVSSTSSVTHRIIGITENYKDTNERAFETKGVSNPKPDKNPVLAANVVGKVVFHSEALGTVVSYVGTNWPIIIFVIAVIAVLFFVLKRVLNDENKPKTDSKKA